MELTKNTITNYKSKVEGLVDYLIVVKEIEDNKIINPDISIDSCKSLIEGLCKKALSLIHDDYLNNKSFRKQCEKFDKLLEYTFQKVFKESFEVDLLKSFATILYQKNKTNDLLKKSFELTKVNTTNAVNAIVKLRDTRGDISHGRIYPKLTRTSPHLLNTIIGITDSICSFLITEMCLRYFEKVKHEVKVNELKDYRSNSEYNHWLNESLDFEFPIKKTSYSRVLFDNDFDMYQEIYYDEYYPNLGILESKEKENLGNLIYYLQKIKESNPELEIKPKVEFIEKETEKLYVEDGYVVDGYVKQLNINEANNINKLNLFVAEHNLNFEKTRILIDEKLSINKEPLREEILQIYELKIPLSERGKVFNDLKVKIDEFIKTLE